MNNPIDKYFRDNLQNRNFHFDEADWLKARALIRAEKNKKRGLYWLLLLALLILAVSATHYSSPSSSHHAMTTGMWSLYGKPTDHSTPSILLQGNQEINDDGDQITKLRDVMSSNQSNPAQPTQASEAVYKDIAKTEKAILSRDRTEIEVVNKNVTDISVAEPGIAKGILNSNQFIAEDVDISENAKAGLAGAEKEADLKIGKETGAPTMPAQSDKFRYNTDPLQEMNLAPRDGANRPLLFIPVMQRLSLKPMDLPMVAPPAPSEGYARLIDVRESEWLARRSAGIYYGSLLYPYGQENTHMWRGHDAGLFFNQQLPGHWSIQGGIGWKYVNGSFGVDQSTEVIRRSGAFNVQREVITLRPAGVHYLSIPLDMRWQNRRHLLGLGMQLNKTLYVRGEKIVDVFDQQALAQVDLAGARPELSAVQDVWLETSSFVPLLWLARGEYRFKVSPRWSLGVGGQYLLNGLIKSQSKTSINEKKRLLFHFSLEMTLWNQ